MKLRRKLSLILTVILALSLSICAFSESLDFSKLTLKELRDLEYAIEAEIEENHTPTSKGKSAVEDKVKAKVEEIFKDEGISVSWPWFDYSYSNDWGYYTFDTSVSYKNQQKKKCELEVNSIVYAPDNHTTIIKWLRIGGNVFVNDLDEIYKPEVRRTLAEYYPDAGIDLSGLNDPAVDASDNDAEAASEPLLPDITLPAKTATATPTATPAPTAVPTEAPLPSYEPLAKGSRGENVTKLQEQLGIFGYNVGTVDGSYGKKAQTAVKEFQSRVGLPATGSADSITQMILFSLPSTATFVIDNDNRYYHMPGCEQAWRVDGNHFEYCSDSSSALDGAGYTACPDCKPVPVKTPTPKPTKKPTIKPTKKPTKEPTEKPYYEAEDSYSSRSNESDYVLNTNTKKFHYPWCSSVDQMKSKNRKYFTGTREQVIKKGYKPCKRCNP